MKTIAPIYGDTGFAEARSLVAEQLGLAPADICEPEPEAAPPAEAPAWEAPADAAPEEAPAPVDDAHLVALERQIAGLEARIADQDAALRRVLDLLIDWVERDPANAPDPAASQTSQTWAAA